MNTQPPPRKQQAHIISVDKNGKQIGKGKWVHIPTPDKIDTNGLSHIATYVDRILTSASTLCSLIIASPDGSKACLIMRDAGQLTIKASIHLGSSSAATGVSLQKLNLPPHAAEPEREKAIRKLFAELNIAPDRDKVHDFNGYADAMRGLHYLIGNNVDQATYIIQRFLREVDHVEEADGLSFSFEE